MSGEKQKKTAASQNVASARRSGGKRTAGKKRPIRREIGAFVCLFLGVCLILCWFKLDAALLNILSALFKGLLGSGFYVLPFSFLLSFVILLLHDGRPVRLRVSCAFLLALTIGALVHVVGGKGDAAWGLSMVEELWDSGMELRSGGVLAGVLGQGLSTVISGFGAGLLLVCLLLLELITALNMTIGSIFKALKERPRAEYDPPKREHPDTAKVIVDHVAQKQIAREERRRNPRASEFDLPVDDPPLPVEQGQQTPKKKQKTEKAGKPVGPDRYLQEMKRAQAVVEPTARTDEKPELSEPELLLESEPVHNSHQEEVDALLERAGEAEEPLPREFPPLQLSHEEWEEPETAAPVVMAPIPAVETLAAVEEPAPAEKQLKKKEVHEEAAKIEQEIVLTQQPAVYQYPPEMLLSSGDGRTVDGTEEMRQNAARLSDTLASFGIEAQIVNVTRGPTVTRYEIELNRGIKLSKVTNLADDIALSLGATGVRIAAIPEKISVVGIEVPNRVVSTVLARDVIDSPEFKKSKSKISFAVGKDIGGSCIVGNIAKLPHMLIAGTTGSGKSVCMNSLIVSLLYKAKPDEVKLIMVDPKMVELGVYNGIPHLLIPVVTDPKKAAGALQWAVTEMMRRYRLMADTGVRDLDSYNKIASGSDELEAMPQMVVVIDELADLMLVAAKEVEESICRVAQMGRAAGIHLVIATQRPSADVITGLMKANIPSRIAFAVASAMESRIILDTAGAEKLVGKGDMLYAPLGEGKPRRVQGCFITDEEVQNVVDFIKKSGAAPEYSQTILNEIEKKAEQSGKGGSANMGAAVEQDSEDQGDEMLPAAVEVLLETGQASVSMLQRRLKLGYARAARIMDEMEERGIVGPFEGSKPRQMLITREQWERMKDGSREEFNQEPVEEEIP